MAFGSLFVLLEGHHVDWAHGFKFRAHIAIELIFIREFVT